MALPSRLGAFMVGAALGAAQCFYWLQDDVNQLHSAMTAKIDHIKTQLDEKDRLASLELAAMEAAMTRDSSVVAAHRPV